MKRTLEIRLPVFRPRSISRVPIPGSAIWVTRLLCVAVFAAFPFSAGVSQGQQAGGMQYPMKDTTPISPLARDQGTPGGNMGDTGSPLDSQKRVEQLNAMRQKEMASDTAKLLALATELKADMDKSNKDTLSMDVVRKAEQIEKLARSVRDKMKAAIPR